MLLGKFVCCFTKSEGFTDSSGCKLVFDQVDDDLWQVILNECVACWGNEVSKEIANTTNSFNSTLDCVRAGNDFVDFTNNNNTEIATKSLGQLKEKENTDTLK